ncbi:B3 domain-containing transcription factor NGA1 isoform X2 [Manihot esculenta]|uniref:Uncharacterized protein n=7 Tax=Manihot esculenta TaxID=3983 RepID=A0ACB7HKX2_MANES|nr:B3 domain-containing transcription factor NGA1 isoform X2 [Manihot esculenta]XP_043812342.1 B3 domain-containing transcription factor NGA1 isoform X2 [Manihot esculenta]KAG8653403.1 hypothetical protein MANES_05G015100v8 [Manihot esculenta]KAG8653404.1 hypothetical protein MANES_05G015100v8 [Manihot esculenta]KAG8653405.1 hypothetical protein MANES_05G015100v8 [Manihot esculenta]KAG8653406.1 hypothetical protein MANES_05G015100v8 [Manihot esculenta]KAG8653407.1 hypothetical protein MANES_0
MNFVEQGRVYCDKEEQEEEEEGEEEEEMTPNKLPFSSPSSSSSSSTKYRNFLPQHQDLWLGSSESQQEYKSRESSSLNFDKRLELMDLTLGNDNGTVNTGGTTHEQPIEREHMFDKVVTPSDVGKLNRLVIPKQHAEKYFPLDSTSNEKGLLLNFEDRNGKPWRFRYSYWNSSQSYVMTKGWSRFVKEKKLDPGDIVSFQRGVGESGKHRLYIDWRRRPNAPDPTSFAHLELQNQLHFPQSLRWGRLYSLPQPLSSIARPYEQPQFQHLSYGIHHQPYHQQYHYNQQGQYYLRPAGALPIGAVHQQGGGQAPIVIDSVPVVHGRSVGKRLRLFGVNVECPTQDDRSSFSSSSGTIQAHGSSTTMGSFSPHLTASSLQPPQSRLPSSGPMATTQEAEFSKKGKTSLSFDLDL